MTYTMFTMPPFYISSFINLAKLFHGIKFKHTDSHKDGQMEDKSIVLSSVDTGRRLMRTKLRVVSKK